MPKDRIRQKQQETLIVSAGKPSSLGRLEPAGANSPSDPTGISTELWAIAEHFGQSLNLCDPDHEDFADSASDVVEFLWLKAELVRALLSQRRAS
jgi:hypothetical protein